MVVSSDKPRRPKSEIDDHLIPEIANFLSDIWATNIFAWSPSVAIVHFSDVLPINLPHKIAQVAGLQLQLTFQHAVRYWSIGTTRADLKGLRNDRSASHHQSAMNRDLILGNSR
jgi:hypothetical protein